LASAPIGKWRTFIHRRAPGEKSCCERRLVVHRLAHRIAHVFGRHRRERLAFSAGNRPVLRNGRFRQLWDDDATLGAGSVGAGGPDNGRLAAAFLVEVQRPRIALPRGE